MTDEPEFRTHSVRKVSAYAVYDKVIIDIGLDRFFFSPELALELAESLKRAAERLRLQPPETEDI